MADSLSFCLDTIIMMVVIWGGRTGCSRNCDKKVVDNEL